MKELKINFKNREEIVAYVKTLAPWAEGDVSCICGNKEVADRRYPKK